MITLIIDLDGTLIDSVPDICASLNRAFASEGIAPVSPDRVRKLIARGAREVVEQVVLDSGRDDHDIDALRDLFLSEYSARPVENTVIYPGVMQVLEDFKTAGIRLGICTNKPEKTTFPVLHALGLHDYFPAIVCGDTLDHKKPDARHVHKVIDMLDGDPAKAVFVGDSEVDLAAARNAVLPIVLVSYGYSLSAPDTLDADILIDHFAELPAAIDKLMGAKYNIG